MPRRRSFRSRATLTLGSSSRRFSERTSPSPPPLFLSCSLARTVWNAQPPHPLSLYQCRAEKDALLYTLNRSSLSHFRPPTLTSNPSPPSDRSLVLPLSTLTTKTGRRTSLQRARERLEKLQEGRSLTCSRPFPFPSYRPAFVEADRRLDEYC